MTDSELKEIITNKINEFEVLNVYCFYVDVFNNLTQDKDNLYNRIYTLLEEMVNTLQIQKISDKEYCKLVPDVNPLFTDRPLEHYLGDKDKKLEIYKQRIQDYLARIQQKYKQREKPPEYFENIRFWYKKLAKINKKLENLKESHTLFATLRRKLYDS